MKWPYCETVLSGHLINLIRRQDLDGPKEEKNED